MAINPNTQFSSGAVYTADEANRFPRGVMGYVQSNAGDITITTTLADLTGMSVTFTAVANRAYRASWAGSVQKLTTAGWTGMYCTNGGNVVYQTLYATNTAGNYVQLSGSTVFANLTPGSYTIKLRALCEVATSRLLRSGAEYVNLIVEDIGPS